MRYTVLGESLSGQLLGNLEQIEDLNGHVLSKMRGKILGYNNRDLNRASPKDDFPLPHIDVLVDNTTQHKVFSFMDGFSSYNQIKMAP